MGDENGKGRTIRRRSFLRLAGGAAAVTALGVLEACGPAGEDPNVVEVPLDSIPVGGRLNVLVGETPVEIIRGPDGVQARSLWCTHSGCQVRWKEDQQIYLCACHDGKYSAEGEVIAGPPTRPLGQFPITVTGKVIKVGESA